MNKHRHTHFRQLGPRAILGLALPALLLATPALASDAPDVLYLTGIARDFQANHPDFEVEPESGLGLYPGNVGYVLSPDGKPVFTGQGARLTSQFTNAVGLPIAPHLYNRQYECQLEAPESECVTVSHNSSQGTASYEICFLGPPAFNDDGTSTWRYSVARLGGPALSHWTLWLDPNAQIMEGTTPGWEWIGSDHPNFPGPGIKWNTEGGVGGAGNPTIFDIVLGEQYYGTNASWVQAKGGGGTNYGLRPFFGPGSEVSATGEPYKYTWSLEPENFGDQSGEFASAEYDTGGITSEETFRQWFRDIPGVNISMPIVIEAEKQPGGSYLFNTAEFFPIDDMLLGNTPGQNHNYHFTVELHAKFTYNGESPTFSFTGNDDVWVFVNGKLAIDLGGVHSGYAQTVDLSRMCMEPGGEYTLSFFFVQRRTHGSGFRFETDVELETDKIPPVTAMFD